MKNLIIAFTVFLVGCGCNYTPVPVTTVSQPIEQVEYVTDPMGVQYVRVYDGGLSYMVAWSVYNSMGYGGCINYYHSHRGCYPLYSANTYGSWRSYGRNMPPAYRATYRPRSTYSPPNAPGYRPSSTPTYRPGSPGRPTYTRPSYTPSSTRSTPSYRPSSSSSSSSRPSYSPSRSSRH